MSRDNFVAQALRDGYSLAEAEDEYDERFDPPEPDDDEGDPMTEERFKSGYATFLERRAELVAFGLHPENRDEQTKTDAMLAIGLLIGAGFCGSAAAVSRLLEQQFPAEQWPWAEL